MRVRGTPGAALSGMVRVTLRRALRRGGVPSVCAQERKVPVFGPALNPWGGNPRSLVSSRGTQREDAAVGHREIRFSY